ncbi:MAG: hypothetical protein ABF893_08090, partial [Gluconacetobacter liquefaciens]
MAAAGPVAALDRLRGGISAAPDPVVALHPAGPSRRLAGRPPSTASTRSRRTTRAAGRGRPPRRLAGAAAGPPPAQRGGG